MEPAELRSLAKDIQANGLQNQVLLWATVDANGDEHEYVLDGRNRLDALELARVPILDEHGKLRPHLYQAIADMSSMTAGALAVALNINRRHLTPGQRTDLAKAAVQADRAFRTKLAARAVPTAQQCAGGIAPAIPCAQQCADGITKAAHAAKGRKTKGHTSNRSVVADIAAAAGVHRNTARKHTRDLKAEQDLERAQKHAAIITMLQAGTPHETIKATLHVGATTISRLRKQIGLSQAPASTAPVSGSNGVSTADGKHDDVKLIELHSRYLESRKPEDRSNRAMASTVLGAISLFIEFVREDDDATFDSTRVPGDLDPALMPRWIADLTAVAKRIDAVVDVLQQRLAVAS
jgi:hypothetical protein